MRNTFDTRETEQFLSAVNSYNNLQYAITQMGGDYGARLKDYFSDKTNNWHRTDFHIIQQTWGNTSGGWQGIGGAAMTTDYTVVITNKFLQAAFVYFGGSLAYICEIDDKFDLDRINGFNECDKLSLLYKFKQRH